MDKLLIEKYIEQCEQERRLDGKTVGAYRYDLNQFLEWSKQVSDPLSRESMRVYLAYLNKRYAPASTKRKIAALRAFISWAVEENVLVASPFDRLKLHMREPKRLPRTIPQADLRKLFRHLYSPDATNSCKPFSLMRDRAIIEMLIATGVRVSELCSLDVGSVDMTGRAVRVMGKGSKERIIQLENAHTLAALDEYLELRQGKAADGNEQALFLNRLGLRMSDRAVREMLDHRARSAGLSVHVTPHMFRHTFATLLLEGDVDIRYIQKLLGHSSISTTEIYAHVSSAKLREIMRENNPRIAIGI